MLPVISHPGPLMPHKVKSCFHDCSWEVYMYGGKIDFPNLEEKQTQTQICTKRDSNPQQVKLNSCVIFNSMMARTQVTFTI